MRVCGCISPVGDLCFEEHLVRRTHRAGQGHSKQLLRSGNLRPGVANDRRLSSGAGSRLQWLADQEGQRIAFFGHTTREHMKSGLKNTFKYLKKTENEAAVELLVQGLDSTFDAVRAESLRALLERRSPVGHRAVFARLPEFDKSDLEIVGERPDRMVRVVAEALTTADTATCMKALKAVLTFRLYTIMPALTAVLKTPNSALFEPATQIIAELTDAFYLELSGQDRPEMHRDYDTLRKRLTGTLEEALGCYGTHQSQEVLEAFLILAKPQSVVLRRILQQPEEKVHPPLVETMKTSQRGGVLRLLLSFLEDPQMPNTGAKRAGESRRREISREPGFLYSSQAHQGRARIAHDIQDVCLGQAGSSRLRATG